MASTVAQSAISDCFEVGRALLKFLTPNNVGLTAGHEGGFYLPKGVWEWYTSHKPTVGANSQNSVRIQWPDGHVTDSRVKWYGKGTRREYRLTRFGRHFHWLSPDSVGDLLVLVPESNREMRAYVVSTADDVLEVLSALGVEMRSSWIIYGKEDASVDAGNINDSVDALIASRVDFPTPQRLAQQARDVVGSPLTAKSPDELLLARIDVECRLYKRVEDTLCRQWIGRSFQHADDLLRTTAKVLSRRKGRLDEALLNQLSIILLEAGIVHDVRPAVDSKPDLVIPSRFPGLMRRPEQVTVCRIKAICKDGWDNAPRSVDDVWGRSQTARERRIKSLPPRNILVTLQPGMPEKQLERLQEANIELVIPQPLHECYPPQRICPLMTVDQFVRRLREELNSAGFLLGPNPWDGTEKANKG